MLSRLEKIILPDVLIRKENIVFLFHTVVRINISTIQYQTM